MHLIYILKVEMTGYGNGSRVCYESKKEVKDDSMAFWLNGLNGVPITEMGSE